jgi:ankyrin repeat protein
MSKFAQQFMEFLEAKNYSKALILVNSVDSSELAKPIEPQNLNNAFHYACRFGDLALVEAIYIKNPDLIKELNKHKSTPFHGAAANTNVNITEFLLEKDSSLISKKNESGNTPLHFASRYSNKEVVSALLPRMKIEDITAVTDRDEFTALILAVNSGVEENVIALLDAAPSLILHEDAKGRLPIHFCIKAATGNDSTNMLSILLKSETKDQIKAQAHGCNDYTPVHFAAENNNVKAMEVMLKACPEALKILGSNGRSALHAAVSAKQVCTSAVKFLHAEMKKQGINTNNSDNTGKTSVMLAFEKGRDELGKFLAEHSDSPESFSNLQQSQLALSEKEFKSDEIPILMKSFSNPASVLHAMTIRFFIEGEFQKGKACYTAAKRLEENEDMSKSLTGSRFANCSDEYPPFLVKETLEKILKNCIIEFVDPVHVKNLENRVNSFIREVIENDKKVILLLTDENVTQCNRAIKLEKKDEDECKITYINTAGIPIKKDASAKSIIELITDNNIIGSTSICDLATTFAPPTQNNKGIFIIEALQRLDKLPVSSPKLARVKSLPTKTDFDPVKAEEMMELLRDTSPNYSSLKMAKLVPLVFKNIDAQICTPVLLTKSEVTHNLKVAIHSVKENSKSAALIIYDGEKWSGVAFKKCADGGIIFFLSDPEEKLLEIVGKVVMVSCPNHTTIVAPRHSSKSSDSGPITLENLHKFFVTDCSLNNSKLESIFKSLRVELDASDNIDNIRIAHIELLKKEGILVPTLDKINFENIHTSYVHDFARGEDFPDILKIVGAGSDHDTVHTD